MLNFNSGFNQIKKKENFCYTSFIVIKLQWELLSAEKQCT